MLAGCGGGSGGSGADLLYTTYWTGRADPGSGTGQSQIVTIRSSSGQVLANQILNRTSGSTISFAGLPSGTQTVQAFLYSQADGNGSLIGSVEASVTTSTTVPSSLDTEVGGTVSSVEVTPSTASWPRTQSNQFHAQAKTVNGAYVFTNASSFTWSTLGGVATVNQQGIALGSSVGSGAVRCTHTPSGLTGSSPITITDFSPTNSKWTVLVYLNAANDLYSYSDLNVNQMEQIASPDVRFVLQWKQSQSLFSGSSFDGTRRYLVKKDTNTSTIGSQLIQDMGSNVDMGDPQTLKDFIAWGKANYPSDRTVLIIWNHGSGWNRSSDLAWTRGVSFDDETGSWIDTWETQTALQGQHFDILAWDASLMQMAEIMYQVKDYATYIAGSEESPPGEGYPYQLVFQPFVDNPDGTTAALSKGFVDGMTSNPPYVSRKITQSVVESSKLAALAAAVKTYKQKLLLNSSTLSTIIPSVRSSAQHYSTSRQYYDLRHIVALLNANANTPLDVVAAGTAVETAANNAIVWEGHNSNSANSKGIAIEFAPSSTFTSYSSLYALTDWAAASEWGGFLLSAP